MWKQCKCLSIDKQTKKVCVYTEKQWITEKTFPFVTTRMNLEDIMLSEISQKRTIAFSTIYGI